MTTRVLGPAGTADLTSTTADQIGGRSLPLGDSTAPDAFVGGASRSVRTVRSSGVTTVPATVALLQTTYYKIREWDPLIAAFETWVSTDAEAAAPSGHTLVGREISARWVV